MSDASGPVAPDGVRVRTHPSLCRGWGNCHRWAPDVYPLDEEGQIAVHLLDVPAEHAADAWLGASVCPERAISVIGESEAYWIRRAAAVDPDRPTSSPRPRPAATVPEP